MGFLSFSVSFLWITFLPANILSAQDKTISQNNFVSNSNLRVCKFANGIVGYITDGQFQDRILPTSTPVSYFDIRNKTDEQTQVWIRRTYVDYLVRDFIVATNDPASVLENVDAVFRNESYKKLAAFPHGTRWLVFTWDKRQLEQVKGQQTRSSLDNVAVVRLSTKSTFKQNWMKSIRTFIWAENRTKTSHKLKLDATTQDCLVFPNTKYGMNGRQLKIVAKSNNRRYIRNEINSISGKEEYVGMLVRLLKTLSKMMNFTYTTWPRPGHMEELDWSIFDEVVVNGTCDFGLASYSSFWANVVNDMSLSGPHSYNAITGLYRRPPDTCGELFSYYCRNNFIYVSIAIMYTTSLVFIVTWYFLVTYIVYRLQQNSDRDTVTNGLSCSVPVVVESGLDTYTTPKRFINKYFSDLAYYLSTSVNQGILPTVRNSPGRVLIGTWGLFTVCFNAWFTSTMTAARIKNDNPLPFNTFSEMVSRHDYSWAIFDSNDLIGYTPKTSRLELLVKIYEEAIILDLPYNTTSKRDKHIHRLLKSMPYNLVFIRFRSELENWLSQQENSENYVIMEDNLFQTSHGFLFTKDSEISTLMSANILQLRDMGMLPEPIRGINSTPAQKSSSDGESKLMSLDSRVLFMEAFISAIILSVASLILCFEMCANKIQDSKGMHRTVIANTRD